MEERIRGHIVVVRKTRVPSDKKRLEAVAKRMEARVDACLVRRLTSARFYQLIFESDGKHLNY